MRSLIFATSILMASTPSLSAAVSPQQRSALVALYESTGGSDWNDSTNWLAEPGTECDWFGVTCDDAGNNITDIYLESNNLVGTLPSELGNLTQLETLSLPRHQIGGEIPSSLGNLASLRALNLYLNQFSGEIPPELGNLTSLEALNLFANDLEGAIPAELGNLTNLRVLGLSQNRLDGSIPSDLGRLSQLEELNLEDNSLTGVIPPELGDLTNLVSLRLGDNELTDGIPETLGSLGALEELILRGNHLSGSIPTSFGGLGSLRFLHLAGNDLVGPIPEALGNLGSLETLLLFDNDLGGTIPASLGNLQNLITLDLSAARLTGPIPLALTSLPRIERLVLGQSYDFGPRNNQLTGGIPAVLSQLTTLRELALGFNDLGGAIPPALGNLTNLEHLDLSANELTGVIPRELGQLANLERLTLAFNSLSGTLPAELGQLESLTGIDVQVNNLNGPIPHQLGTLVNLTDLYLNENDFSGPIPPELGQLSNLEALYLHTNRLTGTIPGSFANLANLQSLQLFGNDLEGPIPTWLGNLENLGDLLLDGNRFTGPIPPQITNLRNLSSFGVGDNFLTGEIPADFGNLTEMRHLSLGSAGLSGAIPQSFWTMTKLIDARLENNDFSGPISPDIRHFSELSVLLFSGNQLSGSLPPEIGQLSSLEILSLDGNRFTGSIPPEIGNAESLEFLGLEKNALSGGLPVELLDLDALQQLRLDFNLLTTSSTELREFVDERNDGGPFEDTQTVPPTNVTVSEVTDRSAIVTWTPIRYMENEGGYEIRATPIGGGPSVVSTTGSKRIESHILRGLSHETTYEVTVRSTTHPFGFQQNFLRSLPTAPVPFTTTERQTVPAEVDLVSGPSGLIQIGGVPQNEDSYVLGNFGDVATTITLEKVGDHFEQEPASFVLEPGATQTVMLRSIPNQPADSYWGHSVVLGEGVPEDFLVPVILLSTPPSTGIAIGEAVTSRVDVFGFEGVDGIGTVRFRNRGDSTLQGVLVSDSAWIRTAPNPITIPAGEVRAVSFDVLRGRRPRPRGAVTGSVRLVYIASSAGKQMLDVLDPRNGSTAVSTTLVTVIDTVVPEARSAMIPDLEPGEIRRLLPGASHVRRNSGTFVSDLAVTNAFGSQALGDLEIFFDRTGSDGSSAASVGMIEPSSSLVLANIVESVYGDDDRTGTIHIRTNAQEQLLVEANLSNVSSSLGEMRGSLPVFRTDRVVSAGQSSYLMGLQASSRFETTMFVQEAAGSPTTVMIEFRRADGVSIGSMELDLGRFELRELVDVAPSGTELVKIENVEGSEGAFVAYALMVDRMTGGISTIVDWTEVFGYEAGETVRVPIVIAEAGESASTAIEARNSGSRQRPVTRPVVPDAVARTSVTVMNPGSEDAVVEITYHESSGATYRQRESVAPGSMVTIDDLAAHLSGRSGASTGFAIAEMIRGTSIVTAAVVRKEGGAELIATLPVLPHTSGLRLGQSIAFTGLEDSTLATVSSRRSGTHRTGFGVTETQGRPVTVLATIGFSGKSPLVSSTLSKTLTLRPRETLLVPDMLRTLLGSQRDAILGDVKNIQLTLSVVDGDGAVTAFVRETENSSGDTRFMF